MSNKIYEKEIVSGWLDGMVKPIQDLIGDRVSVTGFTQNSDLSSQIPLSNKNDQALMIGIRRGGIDVGAYLQSKLIAAGAPISKQFGELNISFYRDDFSTVGLHPRVGPSHVPFEIEGRHILLIDDVLATGRTIRAAMNEIFDYGRPASISLAVLVQRHDHELPVRADVVGVKLNVPPGQYVKLDAAGWRVTVGDKLADQSGDRLAHQTGDKP